MKDAHPYELKNFSNIQNSAIQNWIQKGYAYFLGLGCTPDLKRACFFYDMDKKCCCNIVAPDFSVRCRPGQCGYYEYGKPISEKDYKIQKQMMIQMEMANMSVGSHSSHKKNKKGQQKHPSGIKKHWGACKAVVVLEIHNNGENIQKTFYLEKPGTRTPTTFANVCSQAHANDIVWFNLILQEVSRLFRR